MLGGVLCPGSPTPRATRSVKTWRSGISQAPLIGSALILCVLAACSTASKSIISTIYIVDPKFSFVVVKLDGPCVVEPDTRFDIIRTNGPEARKRIAQAVFKKYVGEAQSAAKLLIFDGRGSDVQVGDVAIAVVGDLYRRGNTAVGMVKFNNLQRGMIIDVGSMAYKVTVGMKFEVWRDGRMVGEITLTSIEKFWSVAEPSADTKREDIQVGDLVVSID
jgi:hypothetical protein